MRTRSPYTVSVRYKRRRIDTDAPDAAPAASASPTSPVVSSTIVTATVTATAAAAAVRAPAREEYFSDQLRGPYGNSIALRQALTQMQADMDAMGFSLKHRR